MISKSILNDVVYLLLAKGLEVNSYSSFVKKNTVEEILKIFDDVIDWRIANEKMETEEAFEFKTHSLKLMNEVLTKTNKENLWNFISKKQQMFYLLEEIRWFILNDESGLDIYFDHDEYLTNFLDNFPDLYYETLDEANELLSNFNINYQLNMLYEKDGYVLGVYNGIVTTVPFEEFDGSTPYLKYYEVAIGYDDETIKPRYVLCGVDHLGIEI